MKKLNIDGTLSEKRIKLRIEDLFPIHRTLVNEGYKKSIEILQKELPLNVLEIASGEDVFDWKVPQSWNVEKAQIKNSNGDVLVDFADCNLHLSAYSESFNGKIEHDELLKHLNYREDLPEAVPYNFHYYEKNWSFNISYRNLKEYFTDSQYEVRIKTRVFDDVLQIGELLIPGESKEEVLITTYMCHPSMVNDNLSGISVAMELFHYLSNAEKLHYSYRLLIVPETIGAISFLAKFPDKYQNVKAGFTVYCCGDEGKLHYKKSYSGKHYTDDVFKYAIHNFFPENGRILPYWPGGSDERQFNGTGVRLPMGAVTRTPAAEFKEYHTSLDNLDLIQPRDLVDTVEKLALVVNIMEVDMVYQNHYKGEPCFSKHNIAYPTFKDALAKSSAYIVKILASEVDGGQSLLQIASKWNLNLFHLSTVAQEFEREKLITKVS